MIEDTYLELFRKTVDTYGDKIAIRDSEEDRQLTYEELDAYAGKVAAKLHSQGVSKGDRVALCMPNSIEEVAGMLGVMKLGASFAPLNPSYPEDRLAYIYKDCAAKAVLAPDYFSDIEKYEVLRDEPDISGTDELLLIYTSGSTGYPKGVITDHRALCDRMDTAEGTADSVITGDDVFGVGTPLYFVAGIWSVFTSFAKGATCVMLPADVMRDPEKLSEYLSENSVNVTFISPKVLRFFRKTGDSLRRVITGSERLSGICSDSFDIYNRYAMSETLGGGLQFKVDRAYDNTPVGFPTENVNVYLLDENGDETDEGEICLTGHLAKGYLNHTEKTEKTFIANPFKDRDGYDILIRTGDIGHRLPDGGIEYLNRRDWMVKINGQRVEPGEIEAALRKTDGIKDAAVKDYEDASGEIFLAGFYVSDRDLDEESIHKSLAKWLPAYMIPARFVCLDRLPVNANGKLDRAALPKPDRIRHTGEDAKPENDVQREIFTCVASVIGHSDFGIHTDLTQIGLSSIGVMRLTGELSERFDIPVSLTALRDNPTVKHLEKILTDSSRKITHEKREYYPFTKNQAGILVETLKRPDTAIYNIPWIMKLPPDIDAEKLKRATDEAIAAHPYLSAKIVPDEAGYYNIRPDDQPVTCEIVKTEELPEDLVRPFDILTERLCRANIFITKDGSFLFLDCHHIVSDGTSFMILIKDIEDAYLGREVEPETYTGFDIAVEEERERKSEQFEKAKAYFGSLLSDVERDMQPKGDVDEEHLRSGVFVYESTIDHGKVKDFCSDKNFTGNAFYNSVFAYVLSRYDYFDDVLFSTIYNGRKDPRMARTVTMLVKALPVVAHIKNDEKTSDFIRTIGEQLVSSMSRDVFSYAEVTKEYDLISDVMFVYQGDNFVVDSFAGEETELTPLQTNEAKESIGVTAFVKGDTVTFECEYHADKYSEEFMRAFLSCMDAAAEEFLTDCKLGDIRIMDQKAEERIREINDTDFRVVPTAVGKLFDAQVNAHPDEVAVIAQGEKLTYRELNNRANKIANELIQRGVHTDEIVGMLMDRTVDAIAVEYGVMKAGGAFLPMLPDYPDDRIDYCMVDSKSRFVLTTDEIINDRQDLFSGNDYEALAISELYRAGTEADPDIDIPADALAYCIYTSGSTGKPKGVMIEHRNLFNFVNANDKNHESKNFVNGGKTVLSVAALSFDFSLMEIHLSLLNGMTLCIASDEEIRNPILLSKLIEENSVEVMCGTPSFLSNLLEIPEAEKALGHIKMYDLGAENFPPGLYEKLKKASPDALIVNGYGPTEATISCISKVVTDARDITIGRPAANVKTWIIDKNGHILPPYARGELVIGGAGVGRGYVGLPEKTDEVFITIDGIRAYRTGDLARINGAGEIEFFGRLDNQVKLHGLRIELDEIENVMCLYPDIRQSVVLVRKNETGEDFLAAWFTADREVSVQELKEFLGESLAGYMIPSAFMQLDGIPMTSNGKVDRKALPEPTVLRAEKVPPENDKQQKIFDCIAEVVRNDDFGITTDVFDTGLTSLGAIRLNVLLYKAFDKPVSIQDLKSHNTVLRLEAFFSEKTGRESYAIQKEYPLTWTQMGILVESMSHENTTIYNIPFLFRLSDRIDLPRLKEAVEKAIGAHPYLNAVVFADDEGGFRVRRDDAKPVVEIRKEKNIPAGLVTPFDVLADKLYRAKIYETEDGNYLFLEMHHIVSDGGSVSVLLEDISAAYEGAGIEKEVYTGFELALEEQKLRQTDRYTEARAYYDTLLSGADPGMLPDGDVSGEEESSGYLSVESDLDMNAVFEFLKKKDLPQNAFFNAVFAYVIRKLTGREDALYTTVYNGRSDVRTSRMVSMLVKTLPVYLTFDKNEKITDLIEATRRQLMDSMSHDIYSFAEIAQAYGINADVLFVYQGDNFIFDKIGGEKAEMIVLELDQAKNPLHMDMFVKDNRAVFRIEYRSDRFSEKFVRRLVTCFENAAIEFTKKEKISEISLLDDATVRWMDEYNKTEAGWPKTDIVSMFRAAAEKYPDNNAVVYGDNAYTYSQTDAVTERIAGYLRSRGVKRSDVVSVLIPRCEYMPIAALGILKAGAAYQPLDPKYPEERISFMMKDAGCRVLIADESLVSKVKDFDGPVLFTKDIPDLPACEKQEDHPASEDLFIMLYTSGSTGVPKGVMLEHGNIANFCHWYQETFEFDETCRMSAYASFGFDCHMIDLYVPLTCGACVYIVGDDIHLDLPAIEEAFNRWGITHSFMTTQVARQFYTMANVKTLRYLIAAGEKLASVKPMEGGTKLINGYGPTETTILVTSIPVDRQYGRIPIGKPLSNYKCYVVDEDMNRLPPLVPGELLVAGKGVGRGYLNRPDISEKVFVKNPFSDNPDYARAYRTGDIVRLLPDGNIDFIGRNDGQVKVRGFRIELSEVEAVIRDFPGIKDVTVQAFDASSGGKFIAAYIVSDEKIDTKKLDAFIASDKPPYMVPAVTMQIDRIPLNQNQKVNKRALPVPEQSGDTASSGADTDRPLTKFEEEILGVVRKIMGDITPGVTENLLTYGLTSINAIGVATQLSRRFNVSIKTRDLISDPSIAGMENLIYEEWNKHGFFADGDRTSKRKNGSEQRAYYPLTSVQLSVYYDALKRENGTLYNVPSCIAFDEIDVDRLKSALIECVKAHPYINTHLDIRDGNLVQLRMDDFTPEVEVLDLSPDRFEEYKNGFIRSFNLRSGPLYRLEIVRTEGKTYLLTDFHHIIIDGLSCDIFLKDLERAYAGETLEPEEYSAFDYAEEEAAARETEVYEEAKAFCANMFADYEEPSEIPTDLSGVEEEGAVAETSRHVNKESVKEFCHGLGVTPAAMFLAVLFETVSRFTSTKHIYISTIDSGRDTPEKANCLGMFVHTLALGMDLTKGYTAEELVKAANDRMRDAADNEIYPYTELVSDYGYHTEILYEYQAGVIPEGKGRFSDTTFEVIPVLPEQPKFKLMLEITETENDFIFKLIYNDALYTAGYMGKLADSLYTLTNGIIENGQVPVKNLSILTPEEKTLLDRFREAGSCELSCKFAHKMFEQVVEEKPDALALVGTDKELTFAGLNSQANIIANNLISRGVKPGDSVVMLLPRRTYYYACLFGILKTGAAFIPCDPEYPKDRVTYITTNADSVFIITTERFINDYPPEKVLLVDEVLVGEDKGNPDVQVDPTDLALMIYTSGSTGKPKGAMLRHIGLSNFFTQHPANTLQQVVEKEAKMILCTATVTFDVNMMEALTFLLRGKTVVFADENQMNNPVEFVRLFEEYPIDTISATPSRYTQYLEYKPFADAIRRCKLIFVAGEAFPNTLLAQLKAHSKAGIINAYAPSECTIAANISDLRNYDYVHLGHPIQNVHEYIVDADDNLVPAGVIGELIIAGIGVGSGYMNLPERTKKSYTTFNGERAYRSGDYAKWDEEGNLILLGRRDNQVKLRGLRIELNEISELMEKQPDIMKAVVVIRKLNGIDNLCAYFTARKKIEIPKLVEELRKHLTKYMVPTAYMQLEDMPYTPNGKTDLKLLPEPEAISGGEYVEPVTDLERLFCKIYSEVLKIDKVGATDDFFNLGGTSLTVTGVMIKAEDAGYPIYYNELFRYTTPRTLATFISGEERKDKAKGTRDITDYDYTEINKVLKNNTIEAFLSGKQRKIGNILLTGATGYMGSHVLAEFLRNETGHAYCLVRKGRRSSAEMRLINTIHYYFGDEFEGIIEARLHIIEGDVTDYSGFEKLENHSIDTVFNCAANVKHFSEGTDIEDINIGGVKNCVKFCEKKNARLIHFSTTSIRGTAEEGEDLMLDEQSLYFGQNILNQYTSSKLISERVVFEAIAKGTLDGKVIRVGLLTARESDGVFQMNYLTNTFVGQLRGILLLGAFPYSLLNQEIRMGPIDVSAVSYFRLAETPKECCLFHATNTNVVPFVNIVRIMNECGLKIDLCEDSEFEEKLNEAKKDPRKAIILQSLFGYQSRRANVIHLPVPEKNEYTTQVLARKGFVWKDTGDEYIRKYTLELKGLGFFDTENMNR